MGIIGGRELIRDLCKIWLGNMEFKVMAPFHMGHIVLPRTLKKLKTT